MASSDRSERDRRLRADGEPVVLAPSEVFGVRAVVRGVETEREVFGDREIQRAAGIEHPPELLLAEGRLEEVGSEVREDARSDDVTEAEARPAHRAVDAGP